MVDPEKGQDFEWRGGRVLLDFDVQALPDAPVGQQTRLKFDVVVGEIVVARLRVSIAFVSQGDDSTTVSETESARTAFASYASEDRARVLDKVATARTLAGLDVWIDAVDLRPNDRWRELLRPEIERRELFLLFWSLPASKSHWVDWEWRTALEAKGLDAIQLQPLEGMPSDLPAELDALHAGDALMLLREATLNRVGPS